MYLWCGNLTAQTLSDQVREFLRNRIETAGYPAKIFLGEEIIYTSKVLPNFYHNRTFRPAWSNDSGPLNSVVTMLSIVREANSEGLDSNDYHLVKLEDTLKMLQENESTGKPLNPRILVDLDLLLTDAFLMYGSHLLAGKVNPETIDSEWFANRRKLDLAQVLETALQSDRIEESIKSLLPPQKGYERLKQALAFYKDIAADGGWLSVPEGIKMQVGYRGERVLFLRNRLSKTKDLSYSPNADSDLFDKVLEKAVLNFQRRHGLNADGIVGALTLAALNVPVENRINQIELNMERWRWLPNDLGKRYVLVNIADYTLDVVEDDKSLITMRVVVGKNYRRTPVFSGEITYLVLNPHWNIPKNIAIEDFLPLIQKNYRYLSAQNIKVFDGWGVSTKEIDPGTVDWLKVKPETFNYIFRQAPGPLNPLGRIKFIFPNKFNVYLHDTPQRELFQETERTFSSGCIRIQKPVALAEYLLKDDPAWTREEILAEINKGIERTIDITEKINIHLLYWTAWADKEGTVHFRNDVYNRDMRLIEALREKPYTSSLNR
ncbi:hypothetical protein AMJ80_07780 [bacterium SM23_31]|nr:MAG: hypothetical protein AMJ80_07780 [bacterium SM23_31]